MFRKIDNSKVSSSVQRSSGSNTATGHSNDENGNIKGSPGILTISGKRTLTAEQETKYDQILSYFSLRYGDCDGDSEDRQEDHYSVDHLTKYSDEKELPIVYRQSLNSSINDTTDSKDDSGASCSCTNNSTTATTIRSNSTIEGTPEKDKVTNITAKLTLTSLDSLNLPEPVLSTLADDERMFLTRECIIRYLTASRWSVPEAIKRLFATLKWRREYGIPFSDDYIGPENATGKQCIFGYDRQGRPCLYLDPARQNTERSPRQLHHLVYMLEQVITLMPPGCEMLTLLIRFHGSPMTGGKNVSVAQGKETVRILQCHYPERLGKALVSDLPWYIRTFFKLISPLLDPVTKSKMLFNQPLTEHISQNQLPREFGGTFDLQYDHNVYWPTLTRLCDKRRKNYRQRWIQRGRKIGDSEFYLRGGGYTPESTDGEDGLIDWNEFFRSSNQLNQMSDNPIEPEFTISSVTSSLP